jgi:hypothetical protein
VNDVNDVNDVNEKMLSERMLAGATAVQGQDPAASRDPEHTQQPHTLHSTRLQPDAMHFRRLPAHEWRALEAAHAQRADALTADHRARKQRGERHPVEDFLWTYYSVSPSELRRWHPGAGVILEGATTEDASLGISSAERSTWKFYRTVRELGARGTAAACCGSPAVRDVRAPHSATNTTETNTTNTTETATTSTTETRSSAATSSTLDLPAFFARRGSTVTYVERLLSATLGRTPRYGCFGLHEWAMVYRMTPEQLRHTALPLRIGHEATDRVVKQNPIACTHFDAFRFFTPQAAPLNTLQLSRETQPDIEQPGCLHAGMDIYKWAAKLGPIVPGELLLDAFELARDIRVVDMQASPYDVSSLGLHAIPIEIPSGKREYARLQRGFADRGNALRERVLAAIALARSLPPAVATGSAAPTAATQERRA